ncbi:MAG: hypothetical protein JSS11_16470 [Verrucomicrobia bacterium]|nr:hypothetical protein [Verrucomicrobiota bacterium]
MKRVEVKLSLAIVAPLLDVIKGLADDLGSDLATTVAPVDHDQDFQQAWRDELIGAQNADVKVLLALFNDEFFAEGVIAFDEANAEPIVRACAALRLRLRSHPLAQLGDEPLESGSVDLAGLEEPVRKAFLCYLFLATIQELIIQHLESNIIGS